MTGRHKIEAAFSPTGAPDFGVVLCYQGIYIRDHYREFNRFPWWYHHSPDIAQHLDKCGEILERTGTDWFDIWQVEPRSRREAKRIDVREGRPWLLNHQDGSATPMPEPAISGWRSRQTHSVAFDLDTLPTREAEVDAQIPAAEPLDATRFRAEGCDDAASAFRNRFSGVYPLGYVSSPLWALYGAWGYEGMMIMVAERPDLVAYACRRRLAHSVATIQACAAMECRGVWIEECMTDQVSPQAFRSLNVPVLSRLCTAIRDAGMRSIYYYCGNPWDRLEDLLAVGADALSLEEGKKGFEIDIDRVVDAVRGRCTVLGNLDSIGVLQKGTDTDLRREVTRQVAAGRRNANRFIMSIGSPVTPETPVDRVRRFCDLARELGTRCP